jgi:hypothetical protein
MALVHEDGTGKADAESFVSLADATARHTAFGNAAWAAAASDTVREQALRKATAYMEQAYRERWSGNRHTVEQALSWPRNSVVVDGYVVIDSDVVPPEVSNACADLALKALSDDLSPDLTRGVVRKKIGPLETEYDRYSPQSKRFRAVDMALAPFLKGSSAMAMLVRA